MCKAAGAGGRGRTGAHGALRQREAPERILVETPLTARPLLRSETYSYISSKYNIFITKLPVTLWGI